MTLRPSASGGRRRKSATTVASDTLPFGVTAPAAQRPLTVSELTRRIRDALDASLARVWVAGEISNYKLAPSGHAYFTLKDDQAQIAAVMFRNDRATVRFRPEDGLEVLAHGSVRIYEARGALQIYIDTLEPRGVGALQLAFEQLKQKLAAEGLFDESRKQLLPAWPATVGIITALRGAAVHDMIVTLRARMPSVRIVVRPVRVQGDEAPPEIVQALTDLQARGSVDVIIVGRGGGSLEDLWAFNDERVARAIAACVLPVVSAVGHEVDFTIADLVADRRAATPTAAAALVVPDRRDLAQQLDQVSYALTAAARRSLDLRRQRVAVVARRLRDPRQVLAQLRHRASDLEGRLHRSIGTTLQQQRQHMRRVAERLHALSPLAVLDRGYAIAYQPADGRVVRDAGELAVGDPLHLRLARGTIDVVVARRTTQGISLNEESDT